MLGSGIKNCLVYNFVKRFGMKGSKSLGWRTGQGCCFKELGLRFWDEAGFKDFKMKKRPKTLLNDLG